VYATREGAGPDEAEAVDWTDLSMNSTYAPKPGARHCEEWRSFPPFFSLPLLRGAEEWRLAFTQRRVK